MSQQSKTTLQSAINTQIADNTSGDISAADIRDNLINITDSLLFNTGSGQSLTGSLNVTGGITGSLLGTASWATNATTAGTAGLITFYPDPSDTNYAILFTDQTDPFNPGVSAPLYDSSANVFTYNPSINRLSLTGSLTVSSTGQVVIITGLPTSEPATSGQLWLSGSAGNSKFLCVRN